ncbi:MAG: DUF5666 domain-containing protein, partial [Aeromonas sp.]
QIHYFNADTGRLELDRQRVVQVTKATRCGDDEAPRACRAADFTPGRWVDVTLTQGQQARHIEGDEVDDDASSTPDTFPVRQFELAGRAQWDGAQLRINGLPLSLNQHTEYEGISQADLDGQWLEIDGVYSAATFLVREIELGQAAEAMREGLDLRGEVTPDATLWGYASHDASLNAYRGQWVELECAFDGVTLSQCMAD